MAWFGFRRDTERDKAIVDHLSRLGKMFAVLERRVSRLDDLGKEGPNPMGVVNRLTHERNEARKERDAAVKEVNRLMLQIHGELHVGEDSDKGEHYSNGKTS